MGGRGKPGMRKSFVALLRGINVGGRNRLAMTDLVEMAAEIGCRNARTYIQSGNVVFDASAAMVRRMPGLLSARIAERFAISSPVIVRSAEELVGAVRGNPYAASGVDEKTLHVAFLEGVPAKRHVAALDRERSPGDSFAVQGRDIYLHLPNGVARTKLTNAYFDSALTTTSTMRNWRTVLRLLAMMTAA